jgi:hypothetical protein
MLHKVITWLEAHMGTCAFREHGGLECPGCGMQRSIIALLKWNLWESILLYPALIPLMAMFAFLAIHLVFKFKHGVTVLKIMYITNTALILGPFIYKIITH